MLGKAKRARKALLLQMLFKGRLTNISQAAAKLNCSKRTVERIIKSLKEEGHQINYNRFLNRYQIIKNHNGHHDKGDAENLIE